jgi:hypothetical protein
MRVLTILFAAIWLSSCSVYQLVKPGNVKIGDAFSVHTDVAWSKVESGKTESWTIDGLGLQALQFTKGLEHGETLYNQQHVNAKSSLPKFTKDMSPLEMKDFIVASSVAIGALKIREENFEPIKIGTQRAYRADFRYTMEDGLERLGFAIGFVKDEKLYLIMYTGAALHYYPLRKDDVDRLLETVKIL